MDANETNPFETPEAAAADRHHPIRWVAAGTASVLLVGTVAGVGLHALAGSSPSTAHAITAQPVSGPFDGSGSGSNDPFSGFGGNFSGDLGGLGDALGGLGLGGSQGGGSLGGGSIGGGSQNSTGLPDASSTQQVGVVDINTVLGYQGAAAAGTGMVLTPNGEVLTNNHVVRGATSLTVTVTATGKTYKAQVVGVDPANDVAVVQMQDASGLDTAKFSGSPVSVGDEVIGVGNAGGVGGTPSAAAGHVTALDQSITATDEDGSDPEQLTGLIKTDAPIQAGDSGGPLYNADDLIVGMDTAGSASQTATEAFAVPIAKALQIAQQIESGSTSGTVQAGSSGFLGIGVDTAADGQGADVTQVVQGSPAEAAGLAAGDVITAIEGRQVTSAADLSSALSSSKPGQHVDVTWTDANGQSQQSSATLASGPAR